jgi:hypothetical protein
MDDSYPPRNPSACFVCGEIVEHADKVLDEDNDGTSDTSGLRIVAICPLIVIHTTCEDAYDQQWPGFQIPRDRSADHEDDGPPEGLGGAAKAGGAA